MRPVLWGYDSHALNKVTDDLIGPPLSAGIQIDVPGRTAIFSAGAPVRPTDVHGWSPVNAQGAVVGRVEVRLDGAAMHADIQRSWVIAGLLGLSLGAALFFLPVGTVRRGDEQNQELWDALSEANTHLEARVEARTAELRKLGVRLVHVQKKSGRGSVGT